MFDRKSFLVIAIVTLITIILWVIFDILHTRANVEISPKLQEVIEPIDPSFDIQAAQLIK